MNKKLKAAKKECKFLHRTFYCKKRFGFFSKLARMCNKEFGESCEHYQGEEKKDIDNKSKE
jgi:hypothetical protein